MKYQVQGVCKQAVSERAVVEVKKKLPNRTLAQNSYLHLL